MPSDLQITNIRDQANANSAITIASDGQITVNQDNPTLTLGSNTTFPTGALIKTTVKKDTSGNVSRNSSAGMAAKTYMTVNCTVGNTIVFHLDFSMYVEQTSSSSSDRTAYFYCEQSTGSAVAGSATGGFGTRLSSYRVGRNLTSSSGSSASSMQALNLTGVFEATHSTHYVGIVFNAGTGDSTALIYANSDYPLVTTAYEIQGDVLT